MVCPTCFCTTTEDVTDLTGDHAERWRVWDSCYSLDFSYLHGGSADVYLWRIPCRRGLVRQMAGLRFVPMLGMAAVLASRPLSLRSGRRSRFSRP